MKKILLEIFSFYTCVPKIPIMWCMVPKIRSETKCFVILGHFLLLYPCNDLENQNFETMKKCQEILSFYTCTINEDHMIYGSWNIRHNRQNFLLFWANFFLPFHSPDNSENQNFEKLKKIPGDIIILHMCTINDNHVMNGSWDMERNG